MFAWHTCHSDSQPTFRKVLSRWHFAYNIMILFNFVVEECLKIQIIFNRQCNSLPPPQKPLGRLTVWLEDVRQWQLWLSGRCGGWGNWKGGPISRGIPALLWQTQGRSQHYQLRRAFLVASSPSALPTALSRGVWFWALRLGGAVEGGGATSCPKAWAFFNIMLSCRAVGQGWVFPGLPAYQGWGLGKNQVETKQRIHLGTFPTPSLQSNTLSTSASRPQSTPPAKSKRKKTKGPLWHRLI